LTKMAVLQKEICGFSWEGVWPYYTGEMWGKRAEDGERKYLFIVEVVATRDQW